MHSCGMAADCGTCQVSAGSVQAEAKPAAHIRMTQMPEPYQGCVGGPVAMKRLWSVERGGITLLLLLLLLLSLLLKAASRPVSKQPQEAARCCCC